MWLAISQLGDGIGGRAGTEVDLARLSNNPCLFFFGCSCGRECIFSDFDADGKTELIISRQRGQPRAGGSQPCETGTKLGLEIGGGRRRSTPIGNGSAGFGRVLFSVFKGGVHLTGGDTGEPREIKGISFQRLICAEGGDDDTDSGDGTL